MGGRGSFIGFFFFNNAGFYEFKCFFLLFPPPYLLNNDTYDEP